MKFVILYREIKTKRNKNHYRESLDKFLEGECLVGAEIVARVYSPEIRFNKFTLEAIDLCAKHNAKLLFGNLEGYLNTRKFLAEANRRGVEWQSIQLPWLTHRTWSYYQGFCELEDHKTFKAVNYTVSYMSNDLQNKTYFQRSSYSLAVEKTIREKVRGLPRMSYVWLLEELNTEGIYNTHGTPWKIKSLKKFCIKYRIRP